MGKIDRKAREHFIVGDKIVKKCKQCNKPKSLESYYKSKQTKDGLRGICKECYRYNVANPKNKNKEDDETYRNRDWLYKHYVVQNKTLAEISREIKIKNETIKNWLVKHKIPLKTPSESRARMLETNDEYREYLGNIYKNVLSKHEAGFKGCTWSDEDKERISKDRRQFFSIPENRERQLKHLDKINNDEGVKKKISSVLKERYETGELVAWNKGLTSEDDSRILAGDEHPLFNNWSSRGEYGKEFNPELKELILERDDYICQECGKTQQEAKDEYNRSLCVHHIDYRKDNNLENNLISLCSSCHAKTNFNRDFWEKKYTS